MSVDQSGGTIRGNDGAALSKQVYAADGVGSWNYSESVVVSFRADFAYERRGPAIQVDGIE